MQVSCPLLEQVKPEWAYEKTDLEDNSAVFRQMPDDHNFLCMNKHNILQQFSSLIKCESARSGLLEMIKAADTSKKTK